MSQIITVFLTLFISASSFALNKDFHVSKRGVETWIQLKFNPITSKFADILFVIDDSGSMQPHQNNLANNLQTFISSIPQTHLQAGVITTTTKGYNSLKYTPGELIGGIHHSNSPDFAFKLANSVMAGTFGEAIEKPFESIYNAFSEPLISTANKGFLRDTADLYIVILTDTQDQSPLDENALYSHLKSLKPTQSITTIAAMTTDVAVCNGEGHELKNNPPKIQNLVSLTGGSVVSLCDNFSVGLSEAIKASVVSDKVLVLPGTDDKKTPVFASIRVSIAGENILPGNLQNGWVYDSLTRTISFSENVLQKALQKGPIEVTYQVL